VGPFSRVQLDAELLQANTARYLMLNKPAGVVSATRDSRHRTALDLLDEGVRGDLHIAGRLDFHSTGLLLLTNDGDWSRALSAPENRISKRYRVTVEEPLTGEYVRAFAEGMWFEQEGITTRPAQLTIVSDHVAEVSLIEGRYHQIKRMFGRFRNRVLTLHRFAVGDLTLDAELQSGASRALAAEEVLAANPHYRPG
jgi:16S rRNA pseudouridine516 synthase